MKLNNRLHNISLSLHTVSGVILCVILFVIFYCGAFSLFKSDIANWESRINIKSEIPAGSELIDDVYHLLFNEDKYQDREVVIYELENKSNFEIFIVPDSVNKEKHFLFSRSLN